MSLGSVGSVENFLLHPGQLGSDSWVRLAIQEFHAGYFQSLGGRTSWDAKQTQFANGRRLVLRVKRFADWRLVVVQWPWVSLPLG